MKVTRPGAGALVLLALSAAAAAAQEQPDTFRLREIVVTATRVPTAIRAAPGAVTVLTGSELRERGVGTVAEALRLAPGVTVMQSAGPGAATSVFMRGGESDYVQVLVDGVQVNDPGGAFNWAHLRIADIDRIEVVRGPASVLYGSDAVAGVVQVFTRSGGSRRVDAGWTTAHSPRPSGAGSFVTNSLDATMTGSADVVAGATLRYGLTAGRTSSSGLYQLNNEYGNTTLSGRAQLAAHTADLAITARYTDHRYHYPTSGSGAIVDSNQFAAGDALALGADAGLRIAPAVELRVLATSYVGDIRTDDAPESEQDPNSFWSTDWQQRRKLDARVNTFLPHAMVLTAGAEREWQSVRTRMESQSAWGPYTDESDESRANTGWYAQLHGTPHRAVALTLGGRVDDNQAFGTFRTGRVGLSWMPLHGSRVHAALGTSFKEPTFYEAFATGFVRGNPELQPERARSWEAGAEYALLAGTITLGGTWFDQRFHNLIQYTAAPPLPDEPNYFNIGAARARGAELSAAAVAGRVDARAAYTLTRTRVLDEGFGGDAAFQESQRLLRRPGHQVVGSLGYAVSPAVRALLDVRHTGERDDLDFTDPENWAGHRVVLAGYTLVDAGATWTARLRRGSVLEVTARVRNLFDTDYQEIFNFRTPGRVLQFGVRAGTAL